MYPFGYGLSYTTFEQTVTDIARNGDTVAITVDVTNTGSVPGKSVVELYCTPPYTNGGIERSAVNLVGFDKTGELAPGAKETVTYRNRPGGPGLLRHRQKGLRRRLYPGGGRVRPVLALRFPHRAG